MDAFLNSITPRRLLSDTGRKFRPLNRIDPERFQKLRFDRIHPSKMRIFFLSVSLAVLTTFACARAFGQRLSIGLIVGGHFTDDFESQFVPPSRFGGGRRLDTASGGYFIGPSIEFRLRSNLRLEVDALYRPLHFTESSVTDDGSVIGSISSASVVTWQFPVLAKYRFSSGALRPFIEGGPSFRTTGNLNSSDPSHFGVTGGAGMEMQLKRLRVAPAVRYTRWQRDPQGVTRTIPNQVEFLVGFSDAGASELYPLSRRVSFGAVLGSTISNDFKARIETGSNFIDQRQTTITFFSGSKSFIAGPMIEVELREGLSVEADAIYRPLRSAASVEVDGTTQTFPSTKSAVTWEFPVLARYRLPGGVVKPILELGPTFRLPQEVNGAQLATYGIATGAGLEAQWRRLKIAPVFRYSHWGPDEPRGQSHTFRNQVQFLTGFSF